MGERLFMDGFGIAALFFVGAVEEQQLLQQIGRQQRAPAGTDEGLGERAEALVGVLAGGRKDLDGAEAVGVEDLTQVGSVLAEAAGALRGGHEEGQYAPY